MVWVTHTRVSFSLPHFMGLRQLLQVSDLVGGVGWAAECEQSLLDDGITSHLWYFTPGWLLKGFQGGWYLVI